MKLFNKFLLKYLFLTIGVVLVALGLELFLVPNKIIDGGIIGVSIMASYLTKIPLGLYIFGLNLPFLIFGYKRQGKEFIINSTYSIIMLSILVQLFHKLEPATNDLILACVFGGIIIGFGLGIIFRNHGSLDGTEVVALSVSPNLPFTVGEIIMFFNLFILTSAAFVYGWDRAMYSLLAYYIIYNTIDAVIDGLDESKSVRAISDKAQEIADAIMKEMEIGVTFLEARGAYTNEPKQMLFCIVSRLHLSQVRTIIDDIDPTAFIAIENVHEVHGGKLKKYFKK